MVQVTNGRRWGDTSDDGEYRELQFHSATAAQAVAEVVQSTLGPDGMDKMCIDENGDVTITNDGATVLEKMTFDDPFGTMIAHVGFAQKSEVKDGSTTAVVVAGELVQGMRDLLHKGIHPTSIVTGFRKASSLTCDELDTLSVSVESENDPLFKQALASSLAGTVSNAERRALAELLVDAFRQISGCEEDDYAERIAITTRPGQRIGQSEICSGAVIEKSPIIENLSLDFADASILLVDTQIEVDDSERDLVAEVSDPNQYQQFVGHSSSLRRQIVDRIVKAEVDVVFCQNSVDDKIAQQLAKEGIPIARFTPKPDIEFLARLLEIPIVSDLNAEIQDNTGQADIHYTEAENTFYLERKDAPAVTYVLRGSTKMIVDELERSITDAIDLGVQLLSDNQVVPGAGAIEMELARCIRESAVKQSGREQLAMEIFANALEKIPRILAKNAGFDSLQALAHLRSAHDTGERNAGVDIRTGDPIDAYASHVVDMAAVKRNAIISATEAANLVLKVDDVIPAK